MAGLTKYTEAQGDAICERIANGESLRSIARDKSMPAMSTLFKWLRDHTEFSEQYARAKEESAELFADEIVSIADEGDDPIRDRLRIDARKWVASKLKPKKYGEKITQEISVSPLKAILDDISGNSTGLPTPVDD